jgi:hypothetical protein
LAANLCKLRAGIGLKFRKLRAGIGRKFRKFRKLKSKINTGCLAADEHHFDDAISAVRITF